MVVNDLIDREMAGASVTDEEILAIGGYAWKYFDPTTIEQSEAYVRLAERYQALQAAAAQPPAKTAAVLPDISPWREDATPSDRTCARCGGQPAAWIPGAGQALCADHQDDY